jgi:transcription elongation GreA/GreB family factor
MYVCFDDPEFHIVLAANAQPIVAVEENQLSVASPNGQRLPAADPNDVYL